MICDGKWLSIVALAGLVACSGEGSAEMPRAADRTAPMADNLPPGDPQAPPADDQAPPSEEQSVSEGGSDPLSAACAAVCAVPVAAACGSSQDSDCVAGCMASPSELAGCDSEYLAFLQCMSQQSRFECETDDEETSIAMPSACESSWDAVVSCAEQAVLPSTTNCTQEGGCVCDDDCQRCLCAAGDVQGACDAVCE